MFEVSIAAKATESGGRRPLGSRLLGEQREAQRSAHLPGNHGESAAKFRIGLKIPDTGTVLLGSRGPEAAPGWLVRSHSRRQGAPVPPRFSVFAECSILAASLTLWPIREARLRPWCGRAGGERPRGIMGRAPGPTGALIPVLLP